jgi:hypothetical protein
VRKTHVIWASALVGAGIFGFMLGAVTNDAPRSATSSEVAGESGGPADPDADSVRVGRHWKPPECVRDPKRAVDLSCAELARMGCAGAGVPS